MFTPDGPATRTPNWPQKTLPDLGLCSAKNNCQTAPDHQTKERRSQAFNAEVTGAGAQRREPKAPRFWRPVDRLVKGRLPVVLYWHPMLNADSRYLAPARPMAPGTRTPNGRKLTNECAGLPRDLSTELPAKTIARPAAVFCPKTAAKPRPNTAPKNTGARHLTLR